MAVTHSLDLEASSSQYASIANALCANLEITGSQTWECWVKPESLVNNKRFLGKVNNDFSSYRMLYQLADGTVLFVITGLTTNSSVGAPAGTLITGVWNHIAGVYDSTAGKLRIYINGELVNEVTASGSGSAVTGTGQFAIGSDGVSGHQDGIIRNVRVWNVARTQAQIREDMNVDTPSVTTGLQGNWLLNNDYTDESSNGYDLTASGSPVFATQYPDALDLTENTNWTKNHKITIDATKVAGSADLINIPIVFTEDNFLGDAFSNSLNGGADLRFSTDIDGQNRLAHEVVSWDTSGLTAEIWVKINILDYDNDTEIYVHYGNSGASALNENEAFGKHQVWGSDYMAVFHNGQDTLDSTKNSKDLTLTDAPASIAGKLGNAIRFDGTNDAAQTPSIDLTGTNKVTFQAWSRFPNFPTATKVLAELSDDTNNYTTGFTIGILAALTGDPLELFIKGDVGANRSYFNDSQTNLSNGNWHFLNCHFDKSLSGAETDLVSDGSNLSPDSTPASSNNTNNFGNHPLYLGARGASSIFAEIDFDEIRLLKTIRSDDWLVTEYNNQNSPSTFAVPSDISNGNFFHLLA